MIPAAEGRMTVKSPIPMETDRTAVADVPRVSRLLTRWFGRYATRHLARHFHSVRVSSGKTPLSALNGTGPLVVYGNHASWWDPLIAVFLNREVFSGRTAFAPIDGAALERYRFFAKLGFFAVDQEDRRRGAVQFLRTARAILDRRDSVLWLTPQGEFADVRRRPVIFQAGIAHLATRIPGVTFLPLAIEYVFWEERFPEALLKFGNPVKSEEIASAAPDNDSRLRLLANRLENTQDALAEESKNRDPGDFETLLAGKSGASAVYDLWRSSAARFRGRMFDPHHGSK